MTDQQWTAYIHEHNTGCLIGGDCEGWIEAHHLVKRSVKSVQHDPANGILLCSRHHRLSNKLSAHGAPKEFRAWLEKNHPEKYAYMCAHKWD